MQRVTDPTTQATLPAPSSSGQVGYFTSGNPSEAIAATIVTEDWLNGIQEELIGIIDSLGLTPDIANNAQVIQAIKRLSGGNITTVTANVTLTGDNAGIIFVNASAGNIGITLPLADSANANPLPIQMIRTDATSNAVVIATQSEDLVQPGAVGSISLGTGGMLTLKSDGVSRWWSTGSRAGVPVLFVLQASALTVAQSGALVEIGGSSTFNTTVPTPVLNAGIEYDLCNYSSATQTISTPSGNFTGTSGTDTPTLSLPSGASCKIKADGANWVVTGFTLIGKQKPRYTALQTVSVAVAASTTYAVSSVEVVFPSYSRTGAFRVLARLVGNGVSTGAGAYNNFVNSLTDGTTTNVGAGFFVYAPATGCEWATTDTFLTQQTYAPGQVVTFTQQVGSAGGTTDFEIQNCFMELYVEEA